MTVTASDDVFFHAIEDGLLGLRGRDDAVKATRQWATPGELAKDLDPTTRQTPALDLIDAALARVDAGETDRLIITMPPQEGKSSRVTKVGATWFLTRNPRRRIVIVSYSQGLADEFGRDVRSYITTNNGTEATLDLGLRIAKDNGAVSAWRLAGQNTGGVRSVGIGGGLTGRPADLMIIDDPISNRQDAESEVYRERAKNWWTSTGSTRLAPGAPVILVLTRWHEDDLAGWLLGREDGHRWEVLRIPAQADHDPNKGETDVLGREPGEYMDSARINEATGKPRGVDEWDALKVEKGARDWEALYQGHPSPAEGDMFKRENWRYYTNPMWLVRTDGSHVVAERTFDEMIASWDMTFKDTKSSDFVVGQVWARRGAEAFLLDQVRGRWDFPETCRQFKSFSAKWPQAILKLVEDKANGTAVIAQLRATVPGVVPEEPHGSKYARASAVSPLQEAKQVWLPDPDMAPWVGAFVEEHAGFPNGKHDDQVDGTSQALNRLVLIPLLDGSILTAEDLDMELAAYAETGISRY